MDTEMQQAPAVPHVSRIWINCPTAKSKIKRLPKLRLELNNRRNRSSAKLHFQSNIASIGLLRTCLKAEIEGQESICAFLCIMLSRATLGESADAIRGFET